MVNAINDDGRIYLTQTRLDGRVAIRFQAGQFETEERDVETAYDVITEIAAAAGGSPGGLFMTFISIEGPPLRS